MLLALDRSSVRSFDQDGHLHVASSNITASQVSPYLGREIVGWQSLGIDPDRVYRLLRDPEALAKGAASFQGKPLLSTHRPQTAEDHSHGLVVGSIANPVWRDPYIEAELVVWDSAAIRGIESGAKRSLSAGYRYTPVMEPGAFKGQRYDGRMVGIVGNHVALVDRPRVEEAFVGDALPSQLQGPRIVFSMDGEEDTPIERVCAILREAEFDEDIVKQAADFLEKNSPDQAGKMAADRALREARSQAFAGRFPEANRLSRFGR